jgi:predicted transcriptional regulator
MERLTIKPKENGLRERRTTAGLSQERLARLARCSTASIAIFEGGYRPARSRVLHRVLAALERAERHDASPISSSHEEDARA